MGGKQRQSDRGREGRNVEKGGIEKIRAGTCEQEEGEVREREYNHPPKWPTAIKQPVFQTVLETRSSQTQGV